MAIKDEVLWTKIEPQTPVLPEATPIPTQMTQDQLKAKIATGDFTASEARQYNQMTWSNTWARDVALTSKDAMKNQDFQTAVTPQEVSMMQDAWIKQVNSERITLDTTAPQTPVTPVTPTPTKAETPIVKIESIEQFKQKGSNLPNLEQFIEDRYGSTATQEDGWVTSVINGEKFKWTIDSQGNPIKTSMGKVQQDMSAMDNADSIYTSLLAWQVIPETLKTSNNYVKAQNRFNQYNQFKNLNQSQYQQLLAQGKLIPGTQAYNDLMNDPVAKSNIIKAQNLNAINQNQKAEEKIASTENNQSDVILSNNPTVAQALEDGSLSVEEYQSLTNTPDITEKSKNVSKLKEEYIRLKSDYDAVEDEVLEEFKWKGKSGSYLRAKIQARRNSLFKELSLSEQLYTSAMWELTTMKNDATALLNTNLQLYKEQQSRQQQLEDRQYQEDLATRTMQRQYDYQFWDFNSQDPRIRDTAIRNAVAQLYTQYPIPGMEAPAVKEQKVKALMAQGLTGQQAISQLEQEIRSTNRYKQMITPESNLIKMWENALYDAVNQRWITPPTEKSSEVMSLQVWDNGWQCGTFARQYVWFTQWLDWIVWATAKERRTTMTETTPKVGWLAFFEWGNYNETYWHIEVVKSINSDGTMTLVWSNLNNDQKVTERTIPITAAKWFYNNTPLAKWETTGTQYTQDKIELLAEISQIQSETEKRKALESAGLTLQDLTRYKADSSAGKIPPTQAQIQASLKTISDIQGIAETDWTDATGKFDFSRAIWLQDATNAWVLIENLRDVASFNNLGMLKWPMSDKDIAFLKSVSSKLDPIQSNKQFEKNIVEMYNIAARKAWIKEITKLSEIPKDRILPWQQNTWTSTWNTYNVTNESSDDEIIQYLKSKKW